jgi:signal transduction histidine kinase
VIVVLAWSGWLAVPWGLGTPAQARAIATKPADHEAPACTTLQDTRIADQIHDVAAAPGKNPQTGEHHPRATPHPPAQNGEHHGRPAESVEIHDVAARAVLAERTRIAGEVHDVAGHGLATIAMQAGVALLMFEERPEQARESLEAIRATSMQALNELRAALDTMHPMPAQELQHLIERVRTAGLPVDLELGELSETMPAHVDAAVFRVVRESLTNVLRHAGPTRALVRVAHEPSPSRLCGDLVVEVADRGAGAPATSRDGRGLTGMRARVEAAGGTLTAGPREGGGFRVVARFPRTTI